jgi:hypothetical protein
MELAIIGVVTAFNILIIFMKYERGRHSDATLDLAILVTVAIVMGGSFGGLVVGTITSAIVSLYLLANPPKFQFFDKTVSAEATKDFFEDFKERAAPRRSNR